MALCYRRDNRETLPDICAERPLSLYHQCHVVAGCKWAGASGVMRGLIGSLLVRIEAQSFGYRGQPMVGEVFGGLENFGPTKAHHSVALGYFIKRKSAHSPKSVSAASTTHISGAPSSIEPLG